MTDVRTGHAYFEVLVNWYDEMTKDGKPASVFSKEMDDQVTEIFGPAGSAQASKKMADLTNALSDEQKSGLWEFEGKIIRAVDRSSQENLAMLAPFKGPEWALTGLISLMEMLDNVRMMAIYKVGDVR